METRPVRIVSKEGENLHGELVVPECSKGLVIFSHGSGSSRFSPRNRRVADGLQKKGFATLLLDLLTEEEERSREKIFDVDLLAGRLLSVGNWVKTETGICHLTMALFGASTGAGAALVAAAKEPELFSVIISRGGRPDLAGKYLEGVTQPTLLIVGSEDSDVLRLNRYAFEKLSCEKELVSIHGATHLFEEPGKLEEVERLTFHWLESHLGNHQLPFSNRETAARALRKKFQGRKLINPIVLGIPRGGVVTGSILARGLSASLDVIFIRKLKHPQQPELAIGAISEDGESFLNESGKIIEKVNPVYIQREKTHELEEISRRKNLVRKFLPQEELAGRSVIVTDDGIATGATIISALELIRKKKPYELIAATPVAPKDTLREIKKYCDSVVCLQTPSPFFSIGDFYKDFPQVEDDEFIELLRKQKRPSQEFLAS